MPNPYVPPATELADPPPAAPDRQPLAWRVGLLAGFVATTAVLALIAAVAAVQIPRFTEVFRSFGADLPAITRLVVASAPYWGVLPLTSAAGAVIVWRHRQGSRRFRRAALASLVLLATIAIVIVPLASAALYLPIYKLGEVV